jgi:diguanylate cyclase (GGDEF)-like protein
MEGLVQVRRWWSEVATKWASSSPLLRASWLVLLAAVAWFAVNLVYPVGPSALLWFGTPLGALAGAGAFWQTSRRVSLPAPARRFWRHLTVAGLLVGVGQAAQAYDAWRHPGANLSVGPVVLVAALAAIAVIIYAVFRLPTGKTNRGETTQVSLDAGAVMLATAVFIWHFGARFDMGAVTGAELVGSLVLIMLASFAVFVLMKALFSDYSVIDRPGLRLMACAILVGGLAPMFQQMLSGYHGRMYVTQVSIPLIYLFAAEAAARQATASTRRREMKKRRTFSVFPYGAVAAVDGLLIFVACFDLADIVVVAAAAVLLTVIVVMRQVLSMVANQRLVEQLDHSANHDGLTGLPNRSYYNQRLHEVMTAPGDRAVTLALLDLDDFKTINDTLGHAVGDALLIEVADRLRRSVRAGDTAARLGGDEFVVLLENAELADVQGFVERLIAAFAEPVRTSEYELQIKSSIGIAAGRSGDDADALLRHADMAMYAAKEIPGTAARNHDELATGTLTH